MKVSELIAKLKEMPPDAEVWHLWDGEARTEIEVIWLARNGKVITSDYEEPNYSTGNRAIDQPTKEEDPYCHTMKDPND